MSTTVVPTSIPTSSLATTSPASSLATTSPATPPTAAGHLPDAGVPFARLVRVEGRKLTDTRSGRWLAGITAVSSLLVAGAMPWLARSMANSGSPVDWFTATTLVQVLGGTLVPVMALLLVTSEWSQRTASTTFLLEPRRGRVLAAKAVVAALLSVGYSLVTGLLAAGAGWWASHQLHVAAAWHWTPALAARLVLANLADAASAFALGLAIMVPAAAIVTLVVGPQLVSMLLLGNAVMRDLGQWLSIGVAREHILGMPGSWTHTALALLLWVALPAVVGVRRHLRAEPH